MISVENSNSSNAQMLPKKKKRPPQRRCGDWCEFLSSKGKLYYFHIKKGYTQWTKPDIWDDNQVSKKIQLNSKSFKRIPKISKIFFQAYEPTAKRPKEIDPAKTTENVAPAAATAVITSNKEPAWSSTMTSLKAKLQLKSDLKRSQKKRRDRVLDQLKLFDRKNEVRIFFKLFFNIFKKLRTRQLYMTWCC